MDEKFLEETIRDRFEGIEKYMEVLINCIVDISANIELIRTLRHCLKESNAENLH